MSEQLTLNLEAPRGGLLARITNLFRRTTAAPVAPLALPAPDDLTDDADYLSDEDFAPRPETAEHAAFTRLAAPEPVDAIPDAAPVALAWFRTDAGVWHLCELKASGKPGRKRASVSKREPSAKGAPYRAVIKNHGLSGPAAKRTWCYLNTIPQAKRWCDSWHIAESNFGNIGRVTFPR